MSGPESDRMRRWRLALGGGAADGTGVPLTGADVNIDGALESLYDADRTGGLGASSPRVARWLGDIRKYFATPVVQVLQRDAIERLGLQRMLLEPELLSEVTPDVHLVATLLSLRSVIPEHTLETARQVVRKVVDELMSKLDAPMRQAVSGSLDRARRTYRPRPGDIDWNRTIRANLAHYQPEYRSIIPERLVGYQRTRRPQLHDVILCVDQSGSMAASVVYASVFGAVLASLPAVRTRVIAFDTEVVDLSEDLHDPVELLFGIQLGGGTDIERALAYCQQCVARPRETVLVLLTDLYEGGDVERMLQRAAALRQSGVRFVTLLALSDEGRPYYSKELAASMAAIDIPSFACTPDQFPELMAAALRGDDIGTWAAAQAPEA